MTPVTQKKPTLHTVGIQINGNGFLYRTPENMIADTIRVRHGDHVKWNCHQGNYTVLFKGESPFAEVGIHAFKGADTSISMVVGKPGSYKYAVTVALPDGGLIVDDPEIIVADD